MALEPVTFDELNALKGVNTQTTLQAQIDSIGSTLTLDNGKIFIGNASNVPIDCSLSGAVTITNTGVASLAAASVTGALLTGLAAGSNTPISATDSILTALANLQAQIDAL